jgi:hypothetical protein
MDKGKPRPKRDFTPNSVTISNVPGACEADFQRRKAPGIHEMMTAKVLADRQRASADKQSFLKATGGQSGSREKTDASLIGAIGKLDSQLSAVVAAAPRVEIPTPEGSLAQPRRKQPRSLLDQLVE